MRTNAPNDEPPSHGPVYQVVSGNKWLLILTLTSSITTLVLQIWQIVKG